MMKFYALRNGRVERVECEPAPARSELIWVDLFDPSGEEEATVERLLDLQVPTRQEMAAIEESARLYREGQSLVMTAVTVDGVTEGRPARTQATFVLAPDHLVTIRYSDPVPFRTFASRLARYPHLNRTAEDVFVSILESVVERAADVVEGIAGDLNQVSTTIFFKEGRKKTRATGNSADLRALLLRLGRKHHTVAIIRESLLSLSRLIPYARQGATWISDGAAVRLKAVSRDVASLTTYEGELSAEIGFLQESTLGLINIEQNAIIKVFSIAAVLFLPPTLVGTVYGMNFAHMPELNWQLGYPLALLLMVLSAIVPYRWFRFRGWL